MAALKSGDMGTKTAGSGDHTGQTRDQIFLLKIKEKQNKKGDSFIIGQTESGKKVIGISYDTKKRLFTYKEKTGNKGEITVPYTKVFKDPNFGGGKGSGGGAEETKITESMQCFYNSYVFNTRSGVRRGDKLLKKPPTDGELEATAHHCKTTHSLAHCLDKVPEIWIQNRVFCKTANKLYAVWGSKFTGTVMFHRAGRGTGPGSDFMDNIYKAKKECLRIDKQKDKQAPGTFSHDKWNPGDIWMTTLAAGAKPLMDKKITESWSSLNTEVERLADVGKVLGVSLKKLRSANIKEFNRKGIDKSPQKFMSYRFGAGDFFNSKDVYLEATTGQMQLRTFGEPWQGQIGGTSAAGGKIGGGNIDYYLEEVYGENIYGVGGESTMKGVTRRNDVKLKDEFWRLYYLCVFGETPETKLDGKTKITPKKTNWTKQNKTHTNNPKKAEEFEKLLDAKDDNWIYSKYMCLKTMEILLSNSADKRHTFMTRVWLYAASNTDQSSFFIKISD